MLSGGVYIPPEILAREQSSRPQFAPKHHGTDRLRLSPTDFGITERQIEVLALMMQGKSNKEICRILKLAEPTVKNHVAATLKALKVKNRGGGLDDDWLSGANTVITMEYSWAQL